MPERGSVLDLPGWAKGLNKTTHPSLLAPNELAEAVNIELGPGGELQLRRGFQPYRMDGSAHTGTGLTYAWCDCPPTPNALPNNPDPIVAVRTDGTIDVHPYATAQGDLTALGDYGPKLVAMNDKYYLTSDAAGVTPYEIAITGGPTVTATVKTKWAGTSNQTNQFPAARTLLVAYERVFAGGVVSTPNQGRSRLYFSDILLPLSWKTTSFIDVGPDDSEGITALAFFADQIIVFKQRSMWGISGSDFSSTEGLALYKIADVGAVNEQSIVQMPQGLVFVDPAQGIFMFDGSNVINIGEPVFNYMLENWEKPNLRKMNSWRRDDKAYISVPWGTYTSPTKTFVWDGVLEAWTEHTYGFRAVARRFVEAGAETTTVGNVERIVGVGASIYVEGTPLPPAAAIPSGVILAWPSTNASIPANWTRVTALDGRYPKGIPNAVTNPGTQGGTTTHTHAWPNHVHSLNHAHSAGNTNASVGTLVHSYNTNPGGGQNIAATNHVHDRPTTGTASVNSGTHSQTSGSGAHESGIPRKEVIFVESTGVDTSVPAGMLAIHHDLTPAPGWAVEDSNGDGTSARPSYWKGAAALGDGSKTKILPAAHTHSLAAHTHGSTSHAHTSGNTAATTSTDIDIPQASGPTRSPLNHTHAVTISNANTGTTGSGGSATSGSGGNDTTSDPAYRTTNFVEAVTGELFVGLIGIWLGALADIPTGWALCDGAGGRPNFLGKYPRHRGTLGLNVTGGGGGHTHTGVSHTHSMTSHSHATTISQSASSQFVVGGTTPDTGETPEHTHSAGFTNTTTPTAGSATHGTPSSTAHEPLHTQVAFIQLVDETDATTVLEDGVFLLYDGSHDNALPIEAEAATGFIAPESPLTLHRLRSVGFIVPENDLAVDIHVHTEGGHGEEAATPVETTIPGSSTIRNPRTRALNGARWRTAQFHWELTTDGLEPTEVYEWKLASMTLEYSTLPSSRTNV